MKNRKCKFWKIANEKSKKSAFVLFYAIKDIILHE